MPHTLYEGRRQYHDDRQRKEDDRILAAVLIVLAVALGIYLLIARFHIRSEQIVEIGFYVIAFAAGIWGTFRHLRTVKARKQERWPAPYLHISYCKDQAAVREAFAHSATVLAYNLSADKEGEPEFWSDDVRIRQGNLFGKSGAGKTTLLTNVEIQDVHRGVPMFILGGKGDAKDIDALLPEIEASGRMHQFRLLDPSQPDISVAWNPCYSPDGSYEKHAEFIYESFDVKKDFFYGHQATYLQHMSRILWYTGKTHNMHDLLVLARDEIVMCEQMQIAAQRIQGLSAVTSQQRENFEVSARSLRQSLEDRERVSKIQGLLNALETFVGDDISQITNPYENLLTLDEVIDKNLVLFISLNTNLDTRPAKALGRMLLQNLQLVLGKRYADRARSRENQKFVSVILDELAPYAYSHFAYIVQTARGTNTAFLFAMQARPQLLSVGTGFRDDLCSAPGTNMVMQTTDEDTVKYFRNSSGKVAQIRRSSAKQRRGSSGDIYDDTGLVSDTEIQETRLLDKHITGLPIGQVQALVPGDRGVIEPRYLQVRVPPNLCIPGYLPAIYPRFRTPKARSNGANLRFKKPELQPLNGRFSRKKALPW